jgi:hypothetical protein
MEVSGLEATTESAIMNKRLGWLQRWSKGSGEGDSNCRQESNHDFSVIKSIAQSLN